MSGGKRRAHEVAGRDTAPAAWAVSAPDQRVSGALRPRYLDSKETSRSSEVDGYQA